MAMDEALEKYEQRFGREALLEQIDGVQEQLVDLADDPGPSAQSISRATLILAGVRSAVETTDTLKTARQTRNTISSALGQIRDAHAPQAANGADVSSGLDNSLDEISLATLQLVPQGTTVEHRVAIDEVRAAFAAAESALDKQTAGMHAEHENLAANQGVVSQALEEAKVSLDVLHTEANALLAQVKAKHQAELDNWNTRSDESLSEMLMDVDRRHNNIIEADAAALAVRNETAAATLVSIEKTRDEVMAVAQALGTGAQSAGWGGYAGEQRNAANFLLGGAVVSFLLTAASALWLALSISTVNGEDAADLSWQGFLAKLALTTALGLLGGYLAAQSAEHRSQERNARRRHLDLLALPPFIANLPETDQQQIRRQHALEGFLPNDPEPPARVPRKGFGPSQVVDLFNAIRPDK